MSRRRLVIIISALVAVGLIGWRLLAAKSGQPSYQTAEVEPGTLVDTLTENGNVAAGSVVSVTSPSTGVIQAVYVQDGAVVKARQKLFQVHSTATPQEQAAAYADYANTKTNVNSAVQNKQTLQAQLEQARQDVLDASDAVNMMNNNRNTSTNNPATNQPYTREQIDSIDSSLTSARQNFTATETKYLQANQAIAAAQADLNSAWLSYQNTRDAVVIAPVAGTITNFSVRVGDQVTPGGTGSNTSSSTDNTTAADSGSSPVLMIANLGSPYIIVPVSEVDIPRLKSGQPATITLDAFPDATYVGEVAQVDRIGTNASGVITYDALINLIGAPATIRPAMSATVAIQLDRRDNVLTVPNAAIQTMNGEPYVRVLKNGVVTQVPVVTGLRTDTQTEIISGLNAGDTVVIGTTPPTPGSPRSRSLFGNNFR